MKPCNHIEAIGECRICWLYENDMRYRRAWDGNAQINEPNDNKKENENISEVKKTIKKMEIVKLKPCINLGPSLEDKPSCGCAGGVLHECAKHGVCRVSGNTKEMNCWRCPDYIDQASQNDKI